MGASKANVQVRARLREGHNPGVYRGKIATLIGEVRVGRVTLCNDSEHAGSHDLHENYTVTVPGDRVLHLEVDRQIDLNNQRVKHLELFKFAIANGTLMSNKRHEVDNHEVEVNIDWDHQEENDIEENNGRGEKEFVTYCPEQPRRPVEIKMVSGHLTVVYTIGDEISFTEFIMALRRILADHPGREDIMDGHDFLNLSSTREHPLLTRTRPEQPARWLHIKLQVVEPNKTWNSSKRNKKTWTTLVMRDDNLYVHGFQNQQGVTYELVDNLTRANMLPDEEYAPRPLGLDVSYRSLLGAGDKDEVVSKLMDAKLGRAFAVKAARVLSRHPRKAPGIRTSVGEALAGLIVLICESARMNPLHNSFAAGGWTNALGFSGQLMRRYVWKWGNMSSDLRKWKKRKYDEPQRVSEVQATYLVRNDRQLPRQRAGGPAANKTRKPSSGGDSVNQSKKQDSNSPPGGEGDDRMTPRASQDNDPGESEGPSQPVEADDALGHGRAQVELLGFAMHPDLLVDGVKIVVFDGKRGQIIYRKDEQGHGQEEKGQGGQEMVDLILTGPYRGISAEYGCFTIKIDIPGIVPSRSGSDKHLPIKWEWDCDDPTYAAQVDTPLPAHHTINAQDGSKVADVTYAVMSNAREATVQVKLRLKDWHRAADGEINAFIDGFDVPSVLFRCTEAMDQCLSTSTASDSWFLLELARDVVAVPCTGVLKIVVALQFITSNDQEVKYRHEFDFDANGICSTKSQQDNNGIEVQLNISWYPEVKMAPEVVQVKMAPEVVHTIGDEQWYTELQMDWQAQWLDMRHKASDKTPLLHLFAFFLIFLLIFLIKSHHKA